MGCNCKQTPTSPSKLVPKGITPLEVIQVSSGPKNYVIEDIIRSKDYLFSTNKKEEERNFVYDLLQKTGGPIISGYCDVVCMKNIKQHLEKLEINLK